MNLKRIMDRWVYWSAFLIMFFGINVLRTIGYQIGSDDATAGAGGGNKLMRLFPSVYLILLVFCLVFLVKKYRIFFLTRNKIEWFFLGYNIFLLLYCTVKNITGVLPFIVNTIAPAAFFSLYLNMYPEKNALLLKKLRKLVIVFFVVNSVLAILEKVGGFHLFKPFFQRDLDTSGFRSTALQNHPLNNGFITAVIMIFILTSDMQQFKKLALYFLGLISIVCFGSRSAILVCSSVILVYFIRDLFFTAPKNKSAKMTRPIIFTGMLFAFVIMVGLIFYTSLGDRLMAHSQYDTSIDVRFRAFNIFKIIKNSSLMWGASSAAVDNLKNAVDVNTIENFWLVWVLRFGLVFGGILCVYFVVYLYKKIKGYTLFNKLFIIAVFLSLATSNVSLGSVTGAVGIYVICAYVFSGTQYIPVARKRQKGATLQKVDEINMPGYTTAPAV